jgi:hypothetical protein
MQRELAHTAHPPPARCVRDKQMWDEADYAHVHQHVRYNRKNVVQRLLCVFVCVRVRVCEREM